MSRSLLLAAFLLVLVASLGLRAAQPAHACVVVTPDVAEQTKLVDAIIIGLVERVDSSGADVRVEAALKGNVASRIRIIDTRSLWGDCEEYAANFNKGQMAVMYLQHIKEDRLFQLPTTFGVFKLEDGKASNGVTRLSFEELLNQVSDALVSQGYPRPVLAESTYAELSASESSRGLWLAIAGGLGGVAGLLVLATLAVRWRRQRSLNR